VTQTGVGLPGIPGITAWTTQPFTTLCWLHLSPGLYSLVIFCVYVISNNEDIDHVISSALKKALLFKVESRISYGDIVGRYG
jgi:hypothetical protein